MNEFAEKYKAYKNSDLLKIIENADDYQPLAVEAARSEIEFRKLTELEINEARAEIEFQKDNIEKQKEKKKEIENKIKNVTASIFETLNPIIETPPSAERLIKIICILFAGILIYIFFKSFDLILYTFSDSSQWDLSMTMFYVPLFFTSITIYLFWKRKKPGWIFFAIILTYYAISELLIYLIMLYMQTQEAPELDNLFSPVSHVKYIFTITFLSGILWVISKKNIREVYGIGIKTLFATIGVTAIVVGLYSFFLLIHKI